MNSTVARAAWLQAKHNKLKDRDMAVEIIHALFESEEAFKEELIAYVSTHTIPRKFE